MIYLVLVLHFIADFILQSREMGKKKSEEFKWLNKHLQIQALIMCSGLWMFGVDNIICLKFALCNAIIHGIIDWNIWKLYKVSVYFRTKNMGLTEQEIKVSWEYWNDHLFYTTIGFDQMLHALTLAFLVKVYL